MYRIARVLPVFVVCLVLAGCGDISIESKPNPAPGPAVIIEQPSPPIVEKETVVIERPSAPIVEKETVVIEKPSAPAVEKETVKTETKNVDGGRRKTTETTDGKTTR